MLRNNVKKDEYYDVKIYVKAHDIDHDILLEDMLFGPFNISSKSNDKWTIIRGFMKGKLLLYALTRMDMSPYGVGYEKVLVRKEGRNESWDELMW